MNGENMENKWFVFVVVVVVFVERERERESYNYINANIITMVSSLYLSIYFFFSNHKITI